MELAVLPGDKMVGLRYRTDLDLLEAGFLCFAAARVAFFEEVFQSHEGSCGEHDSMEEE